MNDIDFRNTLIKAIELDSHPMADKARILSALLKSNTYIEYTSIFTRREWNTYCAFLHIQVPVESYELIKRNENKILPIAEKIFGRQGDHFLTDIETGIIVVNHDVIDFSGISLTDAISKAIEDAGKVGEIKMVCHDVLAEIAPYIASGTVSACLDQDPFNQGAQPVIDAFNNLVAGTEIPKVTFYEGTMAHPEDVETLFPELF